MTKKTSKKPSKKPARLTSSVQFSATELEVRGLVRRARLGLPLAMDALTNRFHRMLWLMAIKAAKRGQEKDDFVGIAYLYFVDCVRTFDFRFGVKFITHCYSRIPLQLLKPRAEYDQIIRVPVANFYSGAAAHFAQPCSLHAVRNDDDIRRSSGGPAVEEDFDRFEREGQIEKLREAIAGLPDEERFVIEHRMLGEKLSEVAARMGVCKERVRQIESYAKEMIRSSMTGNLLRSGLRRRLTRLENLKAHGRKKAKLPISEAG